MTCRILIIEDNQTNIELMAYLLSAFGYHVETAPDGQEGIDLVQRRAPDLILCDLEMPRMNGYEVIANLRANSSLPRMPVVAVTAFAMTGDRDKVLALGFDGYISKPIYPETFVQQVEAFLPSDIRPVRALRPDDTVSAPVRSPQPVRAVILLVDDSPVNVSLIRSTLEPSGYGIISANNVSAALKLAQENSIDLILSDLHMSPEGGLAFLRMVKDDLHLKATPFILLTSSMAGPTDSTEQEAIRLGAARFLARPIVPEQLILEVETCLANKNNEASNA